LEYGSRRDGEDLGEEEIMKSEFIDLWAGVYGILNDYLDGKDEQEIKDRLFNYCLKFFLKRRNDGRDYNVSVYIGPHKELELLAKMLEEENREEQKILFFQYNDRLERMEVWEK
jgi:hypothetical protein